ncbi:glycosyltransferase family 4 protein [Paenibacillus sp. IB182496]|uniref:Glycosyltransferase family 4 protein n=1 Tax=Paenibacillus sabuli TaxID=2772509 RepID=A0A927BWJ7_9BACL|nr:glycosyltransferase family 4 protein [Paenibacillus sabuli]MBD2848186.1 glycosyltransferase family 4 protein [Paenibacillus sabuli]
MIERGRAAVLKIASGASGDVSPKHAPPTIAFVTPGSFAVPSPSSSSVERVVEQVAPRLAPHVRPFIYGKTARGLGRSGRLGAARCLRFPAASRMRYLRAVASSLRRRRAAVAVVENRPAHALALRARSRSTRLWLSLHSTTFVEGAAISRARLRRSLRVVERIVVNSAYLGERIAELAPESAAKLRVVHLGVDPDRFATPFTPEGAARREALRAERSWQGREVALFVGRLIPIKGVHHLLEAMPQLVAEHPALLLVIVGSPYYGSHRQTAYAQRLQRLGRDWPGHVRFVPYVPYHEVPDWYLAADVALVPSAAREAFGLVNVEAMACGLPVVATRAGGIVEIVEDGQTGWLLDPDALGAQLPERLLPLLRDPALREHMGRLGRERVEQRFTWAHVAERWRMLLEEAGVVAEVDA